MPTITTRLAAPKITDVAKRHDADNDRDSPTAPTRLHNAADLMVIFGITGDLARKMTFRALYRLERRELLGCPIIGVARDELSTDEVHERARQAISGAEARRHRLQPARRPLVLPAR